MQKVVIRQRWRAARLLGKRQVESTPLLLPPSRAMIRISARTAAFLSSTVDCTSKLTTLQAALHEKRQRGCALSGYQRSYIAAIWFPSQIEPMLCNAKHGLNVWKQYQKTLFSSKHIQPSKGHSNECGIGSACNISDPQNLLARMPSAELQPLRHFPRFGSVQGRIHRIPWIQLFPAHALARREKRSANSGSRRME